MQTDFLTSVIEGFPMPVLLVGADDRLRNSNAAARAMFGAAIAGRHYITVLRQPGLLDSVERALATRQQIVARYQASGARDTIYRVVCAPVEGEGQGGVLVTFEDISHVEDAEQMRRDFVANVSHELRTPLTALIGFIETLRGAAKEDPVARDRFLSIMEREAGRMNRLVNDLLSLSRVEGEERVRPTERVDVAGLVNSAILTLRARAEEAEVTLKVEGAGSRHEIVGDEDQLLQVFTNLIENAIKYGARQGGQVTVRLTHAAHDPSLRGPALRVDVLDQGEGIDDAHIARLTERFYRVDNHRSREMGGTGLGLAIVKHIVNRHRGRLRIESTKGQGSRFSVILPVG